MKIETIEIDWIKTLPLAEELIFVGLALEG